MIGFIIFIILLIGCFVWIAATSHHCDCDGENLRRLTGDNWICPKCYTRYRIGFLGLGRMKKVN